MVITIKDWQLITVLGDERVVGGAEVDEPVPPAAEPEQHRHRVQRRGQHRRAAVRDEVGAPHDPHVPGARVHGLPGHQLRQPPVLLRRRLPGRIARRRRDEVRERHRVVPRAAAAPGGGVVPRRRQERPALVRRAGEEERREGEDGEDEERGEAAGDHHLPAAHRRPHLTLTTSHARIHHLCIYR